jgi:hypothetical protein
LVTFKKNEWSVGLVTWNRQVLLLGMIRHRNPLSDSWQSRPYQDMQMESGSVAGVVGIEGGVVSGVINLESSGVGASDWRPRHEELYQEV